MLDLLGTDKVHKVETINWMTEGYKRTPSKVTETPNLTLNSKINVFGS